MTTSPDPPATSGVTGVMGRLPVLIKEEEEEDCVP